MHSPRAMQCSGRGLSPSTTGTLTLGWFARAVWNCRTMRAGSGVFLGMSVTLRRSPVAAWRPTTPRLCELTLIRSTFERAAEPDAGHEHRRVQGRAVGDRLVGRERAVRLLAAEAAEHLGDHGHSGRAAHQQDAVDLVPLQARLTQHQRRGRLGSTQEVLGELLEAFAADLLPHADSVMVADDRGLAAFGQGVLGFLGVEPELRGVARVAPGIEPVGGEELLGQIGDQALVEIVAAELHVAVGGDGAERGAFDLEDGDVERAAAEVVDQQAFDLRRSGRRRRRAPRGSSRR